MLMKAVSSIQIEAVLWICTVKVSVKVAVLGVLLDLFVEIRDVLCLVPFFFEF